MKAENWEKIEQIFNAAALIEDANERNRFVAKNSPNPELRAEVLRLLEHDRIEDDFLKEPVFSCGQYILAQSDEDELLGRKNFGHYYLLELLGQGGMGVVYLAQDTRLNRKVALKILPADLNDRPETVARFRQEARAASNIEHPSVAHIYDFGKFENRYYLAMEYVRGRTLRELIGDGLIDKKQALDIAVKIASALESAHASGIIHRDIKPENIIATDAGEVKILDFGLAKINVVEKGGSQNTSLETTPGLLMGTSGYMSPEQVRGEEIDNSTDVWSLAIVLYEMLTGERPFRGDTASDTRAAILRDAPALDKFAPPLREVFEESLNKDKEKRFSTVADFRRALENLPADASDFLETGPGKSTNAGTKQNKLPQKFGRIALLFAAIFLPAVAGFWIYRQSIVPPVRMQADSYKFARRLTGSGNANYAAVSPDGETAVYTLEPRIGEEGLFARSLKTGEEKALVAPAALEFTGVAFSPDGQFIYYAVKPSDGIIASLYRMPATGAGAPQFVLQDIDSAPGFAPDGRQFAYLKIDPDGKYEEIAVADANGANARSFYRREMPDFIPHQAQPAWSSDGEKIILSAGTTANGVKINEVLAVSVSDRKIEKIGIANFAQISKTEWLKNDSAFLMTARKDESEDARQLWRVAYPSGETRRLTSDLLDYSGISVDNSGDKILTLAGENSADLWLTNLETKTDRQITSGGNDSKGVAYAPDGRIVFSSNSTGRLQIWSANEDGSDKRQLTNDEYTNTEPAVSPDGKLIAYVSTRAGSRNIWLMNIDGQTGRRLTSGTLESNPVFTKDGRAIIYFNYNSGAGALSRIELETGANSILIEGTRRYPAISPDGKYLLSSYRAPSEATNKIAVIELDNPTAAPRVFEPLAGASSPGVLRWLPNGAAFSYIVTKSGASNLYRQPIDGSPPVKITDFAADRIYWFAIAPDGKRLVLARGSQKRYVTLMQRDKF